MKFARFKTTVGTPILVNPSAVTDAGPCAKPYRRNPKWRPDETGHGPQLVPLEPAAVALTVGGASEDGRGAQTIYVEGDLDYVRAELDSALSGPSALARLAVWIFGRLA